MSKSWNEFSNDLIKLAKEKVIPLTGQFELTARCNFKCKMCYVCCPSNDKETQKCELSAKEWINLAGEAKDAGMLYLLLTGGEVFLRKDFKTIYEEISQMGFNLDVYTNASLITPEIAKWLGRIPPSKVGITIYGASPETYAEVCGDPNSYERVVHGIDMLLNEGIHLELKTTIIRRNLKDFYKLTEMAESRGLEFGFVNYISPRRELNYTYPEIERLSPEGLAEFEMLINKHYKKNKDEISGSIKTDKRLSKEKRIIEFNQPDKSPFECSASNSAFWVTWDGRMTPCALLGEPATFPFQTGFAIAWENLHHNCCELPISDECANCSFKDHCLQCPARLKSETGHYNKPAPYLCELAENRKRLWEGSI